MIGLVLLANATALRVVDNVDPMDNSHSVYAVVGSGDRYLAIGCDHAGKRDIKVVIRTGRYLGDARPGEVRGSGLLGMANYVTSGRPLQYRFDDAPMQEVRWFSHQDTVYAEKDATRPLAFIRAMKGSRRVVLRTFTYSNEQVDLAFDYAGSAATIDQVLDRCGLKPDDS